MPSPKNKTISFLPEDAPELAALCAVPEGPFDGAAVENRVLNGDFFALSPRLPEGLFDLVVADPPYNLTKDFGGEGFQKTDEDAYAAFTERWVQAVKRLMKPGSLLISDNVLQEGDVVESHYIVERRNRTIYHRMREYLRALKDDKSLETSILPLGDGVSLSVMRAEP